LVVVAINNLANNSF